MFTEKVYYKYYRMIPKGWRQYAKDELADEKNFRRDSKKKVMKMADRNRIVREPILYLRNDHCFKGWMFADIPADARGGLTECYLEFTDTATNQTVIFVGRVKCSKSDTFCYKTGRDKALEAARDEYNKWIRQTSVEQA